MVSMILLLDMVNRQVVIIIADVLLHNHSAHCDGLQATNQTTGQVSADLAGSLIGSLYRTPTINFCDGLQATNQTTGQVSADLAGSLIGSL